MTFHLPASVNTRQPNWLFLLVFFLSCKSWSSLRIFSISHRPSQELNAFTRGRGVESMLLYLCIFLNTWHLWELKNTPFSLMKQNIIGCPPWNVPLGPHMHLAGLRPGPWLWIFHLPTLAGSFLQQWSRRMSEWNGSPGSLPRPKTVDVTFQTDT